MRSGLLGAALGLTLAFAVWHGGYSIHVGTEWNTVLIATGLLALVALRSTASSVVPSRALLTATVAGIVCLAAQIAPLPRGFIGVVSPQRADQLAALGVAYGSLSALPQETIQHIAGGAGALLLGITVNRAAVSVGRRVWVPVLPLIVLACTEAGIGLAQAFLAPSHRPSTGTFANRNHFAGFLAMTLPFVVVVSASLIRRGMNRASETLSCTALVGAAGACMTAVAFSSSRMGFVSALTGLLVVALHLVSSRSLRRIAVPGVVITGVIAFFLLAPNALVQRFGELDNGDATRSGMWRDAMAVIGAYPITGCGYGAYLSGAARFQSTAPLQNVDYAHNDYLQLTAELGIPAMLCVLTAAVLVVRLTWRNARRAPTADLRYRSIACLGAYAAIALHSFVDFNLYVPANLMTLAWIAGIGIADAGAAGTRVCEAASRTPDPVPEPA